MSVSSARAQSFLKGCNVTMTSLLSSLNQVSVGGLLDCFYFAVAGGRRAPQTGWVMCKQVIIFTHSPLN